MNREKTAEAIEVMQAYVDGAEIEFAVDKAHLDRGWLTVPDEPIWNWHSDKYRIKSKPREFWLNTMDNTVHDPKRPGGADSILDSRWVLVREVIE